MTIGQCKNCKWWGTIMRFNPDTEDFDIQPFPDLTHTVFKYCSKLYNCACCHKGQLAGAIGGGNVITQPEFGCIMWEAQ